MTQHFPSTLTHLGVCLFRWGDPGAAAHFGVCLFRWGDPKAAVHFHMGAVRTVTLSKAMLPPLRQPAVTTQGKQSQVHGQNYCSLQSVA